MNKCDSYPLGIYVSPLHLTHLPMNDKYLRCIARKLMTEIIIFIMEINWQVGRGLLETRKSAR